MRSLLLKIGWLHLACETTVVSPVPVQVHVSESLVADVLVEPEGSSMPEADDGGLANLVRSLENHLYNVFKGPAAG